jgi:hypothetical protein
MRRIQTTLIRVALVGVGLFARAEVNAADRRSGNQPDAGSEFETVRTAEHFSIGAVGAAARISQSEVVFRRILQSPTAASDCRKLVDTGSKAGALYGLLGLKLLRDPGYASSSRRYRTVRDEVIVTKACDLSRRPMFLVVQEIDQGKVK